MANSDAGNRVRAINLAAPAGRSAGERVSREPVREVPRSVPPTEFSAEAMLERLRRAMGDSQFDRYVRGQATLSLQDGVLRVNAASGMLADLLERRFGPLIREVVTTAWRGAAAPRVAFEVDRAPAPPCPR